MSDFEVEPEEVLAVGMGLRDDVDALDGPAGALPEADGGVATPLVENAVGALLSQVKHLAAATSVISEDVLASALRYHEADTRSKAAMVRLMAPHLDDTEVAEAVERAQRSDEIARAQERHPDDPRGAARRVLESPSAFEDLAQEQDERLRETARSWRELFDPDAADGDPRGPSTPGGGGTSDLGRLLTGPLDEDGD